MTNSGPKQAETAGEGDQPWQNIRQSLGLTRINSGIQTTLTDEPENFWYFNNGITVLCDEIEPYWPGRRRPDEPVELRLKHVSVVNGAQTVTSIHEAMQAMPDTVEDADISVRVISLGDERAAYAARITETTNTQNDVSQRDFIALDETQALIREDFDLTLDKTYVYKRGEADPAPDSGCSVVHAAIALACARRTPELAVRAKRDTDLLWERGDGGAYPRLFGEVPSAFRIWRCVQIQREVGKALDALRKRLQGRAQDTAQRGDLLITHLVFQLLDLADVDEPGYPLDSVLESIPRLTESVLSWLIYRVDETYGITSFLGSTFTNETRCRELSRIVPQDVRGGVPVPQLPDNYQPCGPAEAPSPPPERGSHSGERRNHPERDPVGVRPVQRPRTRSDEGVARGGRAPLAGPVAERSREATHLVVRRHRVLGQRTRHPYLGAHAAGRRLPSRCRGLPRWVLDGQRNLWQVAKEWLDSQEEEG